MATFDDILGAFGYTPEIVQAVASAVADPTSSNVNAVVSAYGANGQIVPGKLYAYLLQINEERHPEDTVRGAVTPWLIAGGAIVAYLVFFRKKRGT